MRIMINGFGRIGRAAFKIALQREGVDVVRINDVVDASTLAYLLRHDSAYGTYPHRVEAGEGEIRVDGQRYPVSNVKDPGHLPHGDDGVDVVLEASGIFTKREQAQKHVDAGAAKVLITAPSDTPVDGNFIIGVNEGDYDKVAHHIVTIGSCTTNCVVPMAKVLHDAFGVAHGLMTTVHAYTANQQLVDAPSKKLARGRAAAQNIVPSTTGAAKMVGKIYSDLDGKIDGLALRVPILCGSITDFTCRLEKDASVEQVVDAYRRYADGQGEGVLAVADDPLVSSDIVGDGHSCVIQPDQTRLVEGGLVKVLGWYDNEWGFSTRLVDMVQRMA